MVLVQKDLRALGEYIVGIIRKDPAVGNNFNKAADEVGMSAAELFALRRGLRQKPNPDILNKIAVRFNGNYDLMMRLAGYVGSGTQPTDQKAVVDGNPLTYAEKEMLILARHIKDISPEEMERLKKTIEDTIELYLFKKSKEKE